MLQKEGDDISPANQCKGENVEMKVSLVSNERLKHMVVFALTRPPLSPLFFRLTARQPKASILPQVLLVLRPPSRSSQPTIPTRNSKVGWLQLFEVSWEEG